MLNFIRQYPDKIRKYVTRVYFQIFHHKAKRPFPIPVRLFYALLSKQAQSMNRENHDRSHTSPRYTHI